MVKCCTEAGSHVIPIVPCFLGGGLGSDRSILGEQEGTGAILASGTVIHYTTVVNIRGAAWLGRLGMTYMQYWPWYYLRISRRRGIFIVG